MERSSEDAVESYKMLKPVIDNFVDRLRALLIDIANENSIDFHAVEVRAKNVESFREKIERPGKAYSNPLQEITDLCGARAILYYQEDIDRFYSALEQEFNIDHSLSVDKRAQLNFDQFGYVSRHVICRISERRSSLIDWRKFKDINIEIQVRTVLQHGWASISHALQYKSAADTPPELARKLTRLAGLLELADEQFSELKTKSIELKKDILSSLVRNDYSIPADAVSIAEYLSNSQGAKRIEQIASQTGLTIEDFNNWQLARFISEFKISSISELDSLLLRFLENALDFFMLFAKLEEEGGTARASIKGGRDHWCAVAILALMSLDNRDTSFVVKNDIWGESYLGNVLTASNVVFNSKTSKYQG